jgi:hypothetical protein
MSKVRTFVILGLLVGSMALVAGCCGFDPCDPLPDPCCDNPCGTAAPAPAPAPAAAGKSCGGGGGCGGGKSCG